MNAAYPKNLFVYHGKYDHQKLRYGDVEAALRQADRVIEGDPAKRVGKRPCVCGRPWLVDRRPGERAIFTVERQGQDDLAELVHDVVVEQVANLLGLHPEEVDPD